MVVDGVRTYPRKVSRESRRGGLALLASEVFTLPCGCKQQADKMMSALKANASRTAKQSDERHQYWRTVDLVAKCLCMFTTINTVCSFIQVVLYKT